MRGLTPHDNSQSIIVFCKFEVLTQLLQGKFWKYLTQRLSSSPGSPQISWKQPLVFIGLAIGILTIGSKQLGALESWELATFDRMLRWRPEAERDERLLVVSVTEEDIQAQQQWPLSDATIHELLLELNQYQPIAIGLDIYRDIPEPPGHEEFSAYLQQNPSIVPVCKVGDSLSRGVGSPPDITKQHVGFADLVVDSGGILRRGLLFVSPDEESRCQTQFSLSFQLARRYLHNLGIEPEQTPEEKVKLGQAVFEPLSPSSGGYQNLDARGYQILLDYRSSSAGVRNITLQDVLQNQFEPSWVKGKIVLIGVTAESGKDLFYTPYSAGFQDNQKMPGVIVHAQLTSQIISAALAEKPLFWYMPEWGELLWIVFWSICGGLVASFARHPLRLALAEGAALGALLGICWFAFLQAGWFPVVAPTLALLGSSTTAVVYSAYQSNRERQEMARLVEQQNQDLEMLQALFRRGESVHEATTVAWSHTNEETSLPPDVEAETVIATEEQTWKKGFTKLGERYEITDSLASGGFASTYLAKDTLATDTLICVVKRLQTAGHNEQFIQIARRLFHTEVEILGRLGHHPQIPQLLDSFEEDDEFYLVEEYIAGDLLSAELRQAQTLEPKKVVELIKDVLSTLDYLHQHQVIHRDLKPNNLIRSPKNGRLVLIDFGAVKQIQPQDQAGEEVEKTVAIGTKGYTPPEQYAGQPNFSSDLYALGMIGIQALTGISPNQLERDKNTGNIQLKMSFLGVDSKLTAILEKMVRYHFRDRYQSAKAVLEELNRLSI